MGWQKCKRYTPQEIGSGFELFIPFYLFHLKGRGSLNSHDLSITEQLKSQADEARRELEEMQKVDSPLDLCIYSFPLLITQKS